MRHKQTTITLNNGCRIPQFGLGVYLIHGDQATEEACLEALSTGYRHIDTAHAYGNERGVGQAVKKSGLARGEIWITSKLWPNEYGQGKTLEAIDKMLARLDTPYLDLLLLHQQFGDYVGAWRDMEKAVARGKVRSIGLSNFESQRLEEILVLSHIKPAVLQVECHPYYQQHALKQHIAPYGTVLESWYPLGHGDAALLAEPLFACLGRKYGKSGAQIILRWHIQAGNIVFPKSQNPLHIHENFDIFDFSLTAKEMALIGALDKGQRFYNLTLAQQEARLGAFIPED
ncbi:MAG: aldo/keto reductase [Prevotellaceae bacterium]|nr:aldo/keto reductase [Prevotellaceae bacterium]